MQRSRGDSRRPVCQALSPARMYLTVALGAMLATAGFAILLNTPRRALPFAVFVGVVGQLLNQFLLDNGVSPELGAFAGGVAVGALAEIGARLFRTPSTIFTITGFMPLVPGTLAFRAVTEFLNDNVLEGMLFTVRTLIIGGAIAAGLGLIAALIQLRRRAVMARHRTA